MLMKWGNKTWEDTRRQNKALGVSLLGMTLVCLFLAWHAMSIKERIVLVPPDVGRGAAISWDSASEEYMRSFGLYAAMLVGNVTPGNAVFVADALSGFVVAPVYADIRKQILTLANDPVFKTSSAVVYFTPDRVFFEKETSKVFVTGKMVTTSSAATTRGAQAETRALVYEMELRIKAGKPVLMTLTSYPGSDPHTLRWIEGHPPATTTEKKEDRKEERKGVVVDQ